MAKKSPEMQLLLLKQAEKQAKEEARAAREQAKADRFAAYLALQQQYADNKAKALALRETQLSKKPVRKLTVAEKEDARIALLTQEFIAANPHLAPMPTPATPPNTLNPDDRDLAARTEQIVASQEQRAMEIEAARKAYREREHEEWLAAQPAEPEEPAP